MPTLVELDVTDAIRVGDQAPASRIYMTVGSLEQAELLVQNRCCLKGKGLTVFDVLNPVETRIHRQLWPVFKAAVAAGKRAQFSRAKLVVDGVRILPKKTGAS
jgi:hypothetical protein